MLLSAPPPSSPDDGLDTVRRRELADFLKAKRNAMAPERLGLPISPRRRSRGLLREEVAQAAGTSLSWYTWLEQGRDIRPSADLVIRIAHVLALTDAETEYACRLADSRVPAPSVTECLPAEVDAWMRGLDPRPAYALNGVWDVLGWNEAADNLFGFSADGERNLLRKLYCDPDWKRLFVDWEQVTLTATSLFRAEKARGLGGPAAERLVAALSNESEAFAECWAAGDVVEPLIWEKRFRWPPDGMVTLRYASVRPQGAPPDVSVTVYAAVPTGREAEAPRTAVRR